MDQLEPYTTTSSVQMRDIVGILWRRKWMFLAVFVPIVAAGVAYGRTRHPHYTATAEMIVTERGTTVGTSTETTEASWSNNSPAAMLETPQTQVTMMGSDSMIQRTLNQLKNEALAADRPLSSLGVTDPAQFRVEFPEAVKVANPLDTNLIEVSVTQKNPEVAATWANAVCQAFVEWKKELAVNTLRDIVTNFQNRVNRAHARLIAAEHAEAEYKDRHHLVDISQQQRDAVDQYMAQETAVQTAQQELAAQEQRLQGLQRRLKETNAAILSGNGVRDDAGVVALQAQLTDLEGKLAIASTQYTPEYPGIIPGLNAQIADVQKRLASAVKGTLDNKKPSLTAQGALDEDYRQTLVTVLAAHARVDTALGHLALLKQRLTDFPMTMLESTRRARESQLAQEMYTRLQLSLNAAQLNLDSARGNIQVTQAAVPPILPSGLSNARLLIVFILLGLLLATGTALLAERGDHRVRSVDRVRALVGGPLIGVLPPMPRRHMRRVLQGQTPPEVVEAYSLARANMGLVLRGSGAADPFQQQVILITSALPGEGKSVTAAELARSMARSGKKVILVDADMRRPAQGKLFHVEPGLGLADVLAGVTTLEAALGAPVQANLSVLHSGNLTRNPTEMISQPEMVQILDRMRVLADVVIMDAPACALIADALLLAPHADCILQVISLGLADEDLVRDTTAVLQAASPRHLVFFVNRAPQERPRRYRSYYHHVPLTLNGNGWHEGNGSSVAALPGAPEHDSDQDIVAKK